MSLYLPQLYVNKIEFVSLSTCSYDEEVFLQMDKSSGSNSASSGGSGLYGSSLRDRKLNADRYRGGASWK